MTRTLSILCLLCLASCASKVPRAILPPPSVIAELDVEPVSRGVSETRAAVREVAVAGRESREVSARLQTTSDQLREAIDRAEKLAEAESELMRAFEEIQRFALRMSADLGELQTALKFAETKEKLAMETIDSLDAELSVFKSNAASQTAQIRAAKTTEETLRTQVESLAGNADDLAVAEDKLEWWRWYGLGSTVAAILLLLLLIYRPRIPFL